MVSRMGMNHFRQSVTSLALRPGAPGVFIAALLTASGAAAESRPNILFAVADDWSYGHAGAYGCHWVKTPAMDRVAREGILFTHAFTPIGKCAPSRAAILTGRNPWQLKAAANHWCFFPLEFKTFVEALGEQGYFVGMTGKGWAPGVANDAQGKPREMAGHPFAKRFLVRPTMCISANDYAANFADFLAAAPLNKPWCFWYGGHEPHRAYEYGSGIAKGGKRLSDIDRVPVCWPDNETVRNDMLDYAFEVEHFDSHLGLMVAMLQQRGLLDNTLVVVTSDNGMPFPHDKGQAYYDADHLPLAIMWKKGIRKPGRVVDDYVSFIDFAPTFIQLAGLAWDATGMATPTGHSLTDILFSEKAGRVNPGRDHVLIGKERTDIGRPHDWGYPIRGIVKDNLLYLRNFETDRWPTGNPETGYLDCDRSPTKSEVLDCRTVTGRKHYWDASFGKRPAEELYDLQKDPDCLTNLSGTISTDSMKRQLFEELNKQGDPRMFGQGHVFDDYPYANPKERGLYDRYLRGDISKRADHN